MKIALAQINTCVNNLQHNLHKIEACLSQAEGAGVDMCVFPELVLTGYPHTDATFKSDFFDDVEQALETLVKRSTKLWFIVGAPRKTDHVIYNAAYVIGEGKIQHIAYKSLLPNYDIFNEKRYFSPDANEPLVFKYQGKSIGLLICEDIWEDFVEESHFKYEYDPLDALEGKDLDLLINVSASPYYQGKENMRQEVVQRAVEKAGAPLIYVNLVGANDEIVFDGESLVISDQGETLHKSKKFEEDFHIYDLSIKNNVSDGKEREPEAYLEAALTLGLQDFYRKTHQQKAIVGVSGGIDSALVLSLACRALGKDKVTAIYMPSEFSSTVSKEGAEKLCKNLGLELLQIPIDQLRDSYQTALAPLFKNTEAGLAEENIQARLRGTLLMAYSNKFGGMVLNTSNKSEMSVGYSTMYGDLIGGLSVLGDLYKHEVYGLSRWMNKDTEVIPKETIDRLPSAELRADQKDSDSLPEYDVLDAVLKLYIEDQCSAAKIIKRGYAQATVEKIISLVDRSEFKRKQAPPILRVSKKAFGVGRQMNIARG